MRVFFWIMRLGRTRTGAHLFRLGCVPSPHCPFCPGVREDLEHLFVRCPGLEPLWALSADGLRLPSDADISDLLHGLAVVGMTYGACHVPSYLPAGVPGVSMARR
jgi:hypothetical protein